MKQFYNVLLTAVLMCLFVDSAQASKIYQTRDKNGKAIYSDTAPLEGEYKIIGKTGAGKSSAAAQARAKQAEENLLNAQTSEQAKKAADSDATTAKYNQQMQAYCKSLNDRLQIIQKNAYVRVKNEKGETSILGDDARKSEISSLKSKISKDCK